MQHSKAKTLSSYWINENLVQTFQLRRFCHPFHCQCCAKCRTFDGDIHVQPAQPTQNQLCNTSKQSKLSHGTTPYFVSLPTKLFPFYCINYARHSRDDRLIQVKRRAGDKHSQRLSLDTFGDFNVALVFQIVQPKQISRLKHFNVN